MSYLEKLDPKDPKQLKDITACATALGKTDSKKGAATLASLLETVTDQNVLVSAAISYAKVGGKNAQLKLLEKTKAGNTISLRKAALIGLRESKLDEALESLKQLVSNSSEDTSIRTEAALSYGKIAGEKCLQAAKSQLDSPNADDRVLAAAIIGETAHTRSAQAVRRRLESEKNASAKAALQSALAKLGVKDTDHYASADAKREVYFIKPFKIPVKEIFAAYPELVTASGKLVKSVGGLWMRTKIYFSHGKIGAIAPEVSLSDIPGLDFEANFARSSKTMESIRGITESKESYCEITVLMATEKNGGAAEISLQGAHRFQASGYSSMEFKNTSFKYASGHQMEVKVLSASYGSGIVERTESKDGQIEFMTCHHYSDNKNGREFKFGPNSGTLRDAFGRENVAVIEE